MIEINGIRFAQIMVAHAYGVNVEDLSAPTRGDNQAARARQVAMYLAHVGLKKALRTVGHAFGRNHRSVLNACRKIEAAREDPVFDRTLDWLETLVKRATEVPA